MADIKDCPGFETYGEDVRASREALGMGRKELAEEADISYRYLASIELGEVIPSIPVAMRLVRICRLSAERYFTPDLVQEESAQRQRVSHKVKLCPEEYLPVIEGALDGAIRNK